MTKRETEQSVTQAKAAPGPKTSAAIEQAQAKHDALPLRPFMVAEEGEDGTQQMAASHSDTAGHSAWVMSSLGTASASFLTLGRTLETQHDVDSLDPERDGLLLHKAQRLTPGFDGAFQVQYLVGGFAELVTLSAQGVSRKILCEWPDECGQLITPEGAPTREEVKVWIAEQQALAGAAEDQAELALVAA